VTVLLAYAFDADLSPTTTASGLSGSNITNGSLSTCVWDAGLVLDTLSASGATSAATAVSTNSYYYLTATPDVGKVLNLTSLVFDVTRGGATTPRGYVVRSSVDSYASTLATADVSTQVPTFTTGVTVDISGASFQGLASAITFRLYIYAPNTTNDLLWDNVVLNGAVDAVFTGLTVKHYVTG
jgi:hypothetical protein